MREQEVSFPSLDGVGLVGRLSKGQQGVILCHPHPLYGGDMDNNLIASLQQGLAEAGFSTLRFNFRGVEGSAGSHGEGEGEKGDVKGAISFLAAHIGYPLYLCGYSFGAYVGWQGAAEDERVAAIICISPPLAMYDFTQFFKDGRPKLIVAGKRDLICPRETLVEFFDHLAEPKSLKVIDGVDHFWWGREGEVVSYVVEFLRSLPCG